VVKTTCLGDWGGGVCLCMLIDVINTFLVCPFVFSEVGSHLN
jgi:hypothetical protein